MVNQSAALSAPNSDSPVRIREAEAFIFDMDGVLYRGQQPLPGVVEIFDALEARGIPYLLATNNSAASPADYVKRMAGHGVTVSEDLIQTSATATRDFLQAELPAGSRLLVVGAPALGTQLSDGTGFVITDDPDDDVAAVVAGIDQRFNYDTLTRASAAIRRGARFIATNTDATLPVEGGFLPGAGSVVAAIATAGGAAPTVVGKPETIMMTDGVMRLGTSLRGTIMIGDRLDTDILAAHRAGLTTAMVLTGVSTRDDLATSEVLPDYVFTDLPALLRELVGDD